MTVTSNRSASCSKKAAITDCAQADWYLTSLRAPTRDYGSASLRRRRPTGSVSSLPDSTASRIRRRRRAPRCFCQFRQFHGVERRRHIPPSLWIAVGLPDSWSWLAWGLPPTEKREIKPGRANFNIDNTERWKDVIEFPKLCRGRRSSLFLPKCEQRCSPTHRSLDDQIACSSTQKFAVARNVPLGNATAADEANVQRPIEFERRRANEKFSTISKLGGRKIMPFDVRGLSASEATSVSARIETNKNFKLMLRLSGGIRPERRDISSAGSASRPRHSAAATHGRGLSVGDMRRVRWST